MSINPKGIKREFDDTSLYSFIGVECVEKLIWESVKEIFAFKRDLFSVDLICIGFRLDDRGCFLKLMKKWEIMIS